MTTSTSVGRRRGLARHTLGLSDRLTKSRRRAPVALGLLMAVSAALTATAAQADLIEAVPTGWRLQDYGPSGIGVYFTGSPCVSGVMAFPSGTGFSPDRFWATVMTAKVTGRMIGVYYHVDNGSCVIDNFYLKESG